MASQVAVLMTILLGGGCVSLAKDAAVPPTNYAIQVQDSSIEDVPKYGTVLQFNIDIVNTGGTPYEVIVTPQRCCLEIAHNDTDCESMQLRPPKTLQLGLVDSYDNTTGRATFLFRNLYCRFRKGNCTFLISTKGKSPFKWKHAVLFDTFPDDDDYEKCTGLDQDPDRSCSPVDCAIKYKGKRNFYRNTTGRCEPVVKCHTRGPDGVAIIAYYDTELNLCHSLDMNSSENAVYLTEMSSSNPADQALMSSLFKNLTDDDIDVSEEASLGFTALDCNHGTQDEDVCVCDEGWTSSGVDSNDQEHWCDVMKGSGWFDTGPIELGYLQEIATIIGLLVLNIALLVGWAVLVYCLSCRGKRNSTK